MKKLALIILAVAAALPASAPAAGCRPLDCAPSGSMLGTGSLAFRPQGLTGPVYVLDLTSGALRRHLPTGILAGRTLVHSDTSTLTWYDAASGQVTGTAEVSDQSNPFLVGTSQDGRRAVLQRASGKPKRTTFVIATTSGERAVQFAGTNWEFDALAGRNLYLLRYLKNGYQVRRYDLAAGKLDPAPLKDPHESALIWGTAWSRVSSPDGRYVFTLYIGQNGGTMVHELDVRSSTARCIDLPGTGDFNAGTSYAMELSRDGKSLWAVSPGYGRVVAIDVRQARVRLSFAFPKADAIEAPAGAVSALAPDGSRVAIAVNTRIWLVSTVHRSVVEIKPHAALALGFAPDGSRLWVVGKSSGKADWVPIARSA